MNARPFNHLAHRLLAMGLLLLAMALCGALTGCGGGDPEPEPDVPTPQLNCQQRPELCR